jgi:hypothetical protein
VGGAEHRVVRDDGQLGSSIGACTSRTLRQPRSATRRAATSSIARGVDADDHALRPDPAAHLLEAQAGAASDVEHDVAGRSGNRSTRRRR